mmetsp:Transcript_27573/g.27442  ORF Transcript_27573/g.27442 Transcript_27573/m.27442 type:complete len:124 (+) Transcript_27573:460-831(+)
MVHMARLNLLVIHGGRTSQNISSINTRSSLVLSKGKSNLFESTGLAKKPTTFILGDIFALKLDTLEWIRVISPNELKLARANHTMAKINDDSLIIFGGNSANSTYCSSDYIITFREKKLAGET